jgi:nucleotide-binding universal stress UspA family protein
VDPSSIRLVIGFDSTKGAQAAVDAISKRTWPANTEVRLVSVFHDATAEMVGNYETPLRSGEVGSFSAEHGVISELADAAIEKLERTGPMVEFYIESGDVKTELPRHAESWDADCIFIGANAFGGTIERYLIGSTSSAIATRAKCSVEVVRSC